MAQVVIDPGDWILSVDSLGRFHADLPGAGTYRLRALAPMHETSGWLLVTATDEEPLARAELSLEPQAYRVPTVEIYGERIRPDPPQAPSRLILAREIRRAPGGFQDPLRALQESRSIETRNDLGTLLSIRGGEPDQVLFLMDGFDAYNPYRMRIVLGGGLSLANPDIVESVELYAGGFSARYGNRTSGVIHLRTREGNRHSFRSRQTLSLIAASTALEGPLPGGRGSWILGLRRTYYDLILRPPKGEGTQYPYLQEAQGRLDWDPALGHRLIARFALGDEGIDYIFPGEAGEQGADTRGSSGSSGFSIEHACDLREGLRAISKGSLLTDRTRVRIQGTDDRVSYAAARTRALRISASHEWEVDAAPHVLRIGASWDRYRSRVGWDAEADAAPSLNPTPASLDMDDLLAYRAAWAEDVVGFGRDWFLSLGLRIEDASGPSPIQVSPRVALRGRIKGPLGFRVGAGQFLQYPDGIQSFSREAPLSIRPLSAYPPERAALASAGLNATWRRIDWTLETYTRDTRDLLVPADRVAYTAISEGRALARGIEAEIGLRPLPRRGGDRRWIDDLEATLAHAWIDSRFRGGVYDRWTRVSAEREQSFLARARFPARAGWTLSFVLRVASGAPYTPLRARFTRWDSDGDPVHVPVWGDPFSEKMSSYGRLDGRVEREISIFGRSGSIFLEVLNMTARKNSVSMIWNRDLDRRRPVRGLPLLPFIGMTVAG